ncbi:alpha/beta fold hydrolase [Maribacter sp. 2210JD10-5]|uniref:alpha/beta fold hydrolase n=1 Tax=Maribacter sp. 2210JD10-5 TaxID=3386272 RepID=UPI0039BC4DCB
MFKKGIRYSGLLLSLFMLTLWVYSCASIPKLSKENRATIKKVLQSPIPEVVTGETGFATSGNHKIWFEKISPSTSQKGTMLLIMGNGQDALAWPPTFISNLVDAGYVVIRYDHRGTGLSLAEEKWDKKNPYTLADMAKDALAVLDATETEKAHVIGVSMGGMIAQIITLEYSKRTASLTSIMSSANIMDSELAPMSDEVLPKMISAVLHHGLLGSKKGQIKRQIVQRRILMGKASGTIDVKSMAEIAFYNLKKREGYRLMTARHHYAAILEASSREEKLKTVSVPTLIIHGVQDPVMPIAHGKKMAKIIPNADTLYIENMGHDLPYHAMGRITDKIILNARKGG